MNNDKSYIRKRLRDHLALVPDLPEINWENRRFEPKEVQGKFTPYIRETLMLSGEDVTANDERTNRGIYQLDYFIPSGGELKVYEDKADEIKEHFKPAQTIDGLILTKASVLDGNPQNPWYIIPIQINFRTHQPNT